MNTHYAIWEVGGYVLAVGRTEEEVCCNYAVRLEGRSGRKVDIEIGYYVHAHTPCGKVVLTKCTETIYLEFGKGRTNFPQEFRHGLLCYQNCLNESESNEIEAAQVDKDLLSVKGILEKVDADILEAIALLELAETKAQAQGEINIAGRAGDLVIGLRNLRGEYQDGHGCIFGLIGVLEILSHPMREIDDGQRNVDSE